MSPLFPLLLTLALARVPTPDDPGPGRIDVTSLAAKGPGVGPARGPWLGARLGELVRGIEPACYAAALERKASAGGELTIKATFGRNARFSGVSVTAARGATLDWRLRGCIQRLVTSARLDMSPLPPVEHDPELPGAYYDPPRSPPRRDELPIRITLGLRLTPPVVAAPEPEPEPAPILRPPPGGPGKCKGPSPAGCRSKGCGPGFVCDTKVSCIPSSCGCNPETGAWICTADCGGGMCVPEGSRSPW
ncbi:MAG: hypothetical protein IT385_24970 [Deltaproteobacteria bacterium]|nr:hypothetical protein [Deltaproteobacteria bacterium]